MMYISKISSYGHNGSQFLIYIITLVLQLAKRQRGRDIAHLMRFAISVGTFLLNTKWQLRPPWTTLYYRLYNETGIASINYK